MSDEWVEATLSDLVSVKPGKYIPKSDYVEDGAYWIYGSNSVMGRYDKALVEEPHVVMAAVGAYAGASRYSEAPSWVNNNAFALVPNERVTPFFIYLWLSGVLDLAQVLAGTGQPYVKRPRLLDQKVLLPPLPVQLRIVDLIAHLDNHLAKLQIEREALEAARHVALRLSLAGDLLDELGSEWSTSTLGEVTEIRGGGTPSTKEPDFWGGEIVWLTPTEVVKADGQRIGSSERCITQQGLNHSSAKLLPEGSVLLTTRASVGFVAISDKPLATNQGFQSLIPGNQVLPQFLMYWIQGNRDEFTQRASGSTFPEISKKKVASIPITYPSLALQNRIVSLMADMDEQIIALTEEFDGLSDLRSSLLSNLLSGTVEVLHNYDSLLSEVA